MIEVGSGPSQTGSAWQYRARGSGGYDPGFPNHLVVHHTASGPSSDGWGDTNYCAFGHPDAPVGNLYLSRDGTVYVMAGGAANTNGTGHDPCGLVPDDGMNSRSIAIEAANGGTGEPWPEDQQDSYRRLCASLLAAYGIGVAQLHSHFEWAPGRKIDPTGQSAYATGSAMWNMGAFRSDVANLNEPDPTPIPIPPPEEEDMLRTVLVPTFEGGQPWWPWLATFDSGAVRPLASHEPEPLSGKHDLTSMDQYKILCAWAGINLQVKP